MMFVPMHAFFDVFITIIHNRSELRHVIMSVWLIQKSIAQITLLKVAKNSVKEESIDLLTASSSTAFHQDTLVVVPQYCNSLISCQQRRVPL